ncbi:MAG: HAMP domain-containing protein [Spirulina sp. SIO3F2]|nr:HAMP domain-containing protein [Spirulina sp. SIO3F2]
MVDPPFDQKSSPVRSLTVKTLLNMALRLALVVLTISGISYWHLMSQLAHDTQAQLLGYITERGQREEAVFVIAQTNHTLLRQQFLDQLAILDHHDGQTAFDRQFFQWSDHTVRNVSEDKQFDTFDTEHYPTTFVQPDVDLNADFKSRLALSYNLVEQYGLGWQTNFLNTYISLPEGAVNVYIPGVDYGISAPTDYDIRAEEWAYLGDVVHNPERKTLWTGVYRDSVMEKWVVSAETPIDDSNGRHLGTIGHDLVLNDLITRVIDDHLDGTYNVLVRTDGQLIAAPQMMDLIQAEAGKLTVQTVSDPSLQRVFSFAQQTSQQYSVVYNPDDREYLAIARLKGPDWYLITVYPEKLLQNQALSNTWFLLAVGLASLLVEVLLLFIVLRRQVATPLKSLLGATQQVTAGDFAVDLDVQRQDELGQLAQAFTRMTHQLQDTFTDLEQKIVEQQQTESLILKKTHALEQALQERKQMQLQTIQNEKKMAALGNLISGVAHEINNPTGFLKGNIQPAQDYTQELFQLIDFLLEKCPNDPDIQEELEDIDFKFICEDLPQLLNSMNVGIDRIQDISNSLRTFSRTDQDHKTEFDIHNGLNSTLLILKHRTKANDKRPALEIIKDYDDLPKVHCFPGQLNQVFMNLLTNAIDAFDEANAGKTFAEIAANPNRITICTTCAENQVQIEIQDNGCGMSPETQARIFEQGFTTKEVGQGTGLGMAIAHQIITDKHGGVINCTSKLGQGTTFNITLPLADI